MRSRDRRPKRPTVECHRGEPSPGADLGRPSYVNRSVSTSLSQSPIHAGVCSLTHHHSPPAPVAAPPHRAAASQRCARADQRTCAFTSSRRLKRTSLSVSADAGPSVALLSLAPCTESHTTHNIQQTTHTRPHTYAHTPTHTRPHTNAHTHTHTRPHTSAHMPTHVGAKRRAVRRACRCTRDL